MGKSTAAEKSGRKTTNDFTCPNCRKNTVKKSGFVFFEKGRWNEGSSTYEEEGKIREYICEKCDFRFAVIYKENAKMPKQASKTS